MEKIPRPVIAPPSTPAPPPEKRQGGLGNQSWKRRTKHGRDKIFSEGPILREAAESFFHWCDTNPRLRAELVKSKLDYEEVGVALGRPYTMDGLCTYLGVSGAYFRQARIALRDKMVRKIATPAEEELLEVIEWVELVVRADQLEGALVNQYNPNLVARINHIADNVNSAVSGETVVQVTVRDQKTATDLDKLRDML